MVEKVVNPETGRWITKYGKTYEKVFGSAVRAANVKNFDARRETETSPNRGMRKGNSTPGCTNADRNKYPEVKESDFCGREGGTRCDRSFPVNSPKRARAALAYARHAPNPEGIRRCVARKVREHGWSDASGKIKMNAPRGSPRGRRPS